MHRSQSNRSSLWLTTARNPSAAWLFPTELGELGDAADRVRGQEFGNEAAIGLQLEDDAGRLRIAERIDVKHVGFRADGPVDESFERIALVPRESIDVGNVPTLVIAEEVDRVLIGVDAADHSKGGGRYAGSRPAADEDDPLPVRRQFADPLFELLGETDLLGRFGRAIEVADLDGEPLGPAGNRRARHPQLIFRPLKLGLDAAGLRLVPHLRVESGEELHHLRDGVPLLLRQTVAGIDDSIDRQLRERTLPLGLDAKLIGPSQERVGDDLLGRDQSGLRELGIGAEIGLTAIECALEEDVIDFLVVVFLLVGIIAAFTETENHALTSRCPIVFDFKADRRRPASFGARSVAIRPRGSSATAVRRCRAAASTSPP